MAEQWQTDPSKITVRPCLCCGDTRATERFSLDNEEDVRGYLEEILIALGDIPEEEFWYLWRDGSPQDWEFCCACGSVWGD